MLNVDILKLESTLLACDESSFSDRSIKNDDGVLSRFIVGEEVLTGRIYSLKPIDIFGKIVFHSYSLEGAACGTNDTVGMSIFVV